MGKIKDKSGQKSQYGLLEIRLENPTEHRSGYPPRKSALFLLLPHLPSTPFAFLLVPSGWYINAEGSSGPQE